MANPRLKNREQFTSSLRPELLNTLRDLSDNTRINMSLLLDEAVEDLLKKYGKEILKNETPTLKNKKR